jgi:hypothetical protein
MFCCKRLNFNTSKVQEQSILSSDFFFPFCTSTYYLHGFCNLLTGFSHSWVIFFKTHVDLFFGIFFFPHPLTPAQVLPTCLHLDNLPMHPGLLLPTYLPTCPATFLPTHPFTFLPMNLPTYVPAHSISAKAMTTQVNLDTTIY